MTKKKSATKKAEVQLDLAEVQLDATPSIEEKLQCIIDALNLKNDELKALLIDKDNTIDLMVEQETFLNAQIAEAMPLVGVALESTSPDLRTTMLMALVPNISLEYPRDGAQKANKAVDIIMEVWGME